MAPVIIQQTSKIFSLTGQGTTGSVFVYGVANNVVVWMMFSALFLLAMFFLFYNVIHKKNGVKLSDYGLAISLADIGRIILLAIAVILTCRSGKDTSDYDIVMGGVANDKVFNTVELYFDGLIDKSEAINRLRYEKPNMQICLRTENAIENYLHFEGSEQI